MTHDLGGKPGFGAVIPEPDEPVFHAGWEARVFGLAATLPYAIGTSDDQFRPAIEAMDPARYLATSYYEKWLYALEHLAQGPATGPAITAPEVAQAILAGASQAVPDTPRRFGVGDAVRTRPTGAIHTRLPAYAAGKPGRIETLHGGFLLADAHHLGQRRAEMLYTVVFTARDLWGHDGDPVSLDLWDSYLVPL